MKKIQKGFTLIELLVVIAIIGLLASIVLVSVGDARDKGSDAAIKANVSGIRTQAEVFADKGTKYLSTSFTEGNCMDNVTAPVFTSNVLTAGSLFSDPGIKNAIAAANKAASGAVTTNAYTKTWCAATATSWAVAVVLKSDSAYAWCADSSGLSQRIAGESGTLTTAAITGAGSASDPYLCRTAS